MLWGFLWLVPSSQAQLGATLCIISWAAVEIPRYARVKREDGDTPLPPTLPTNASFHMPLDELLSADNVCFVSRDPEEREKS